jgi:ribosome biogenesis ATPase
MSGESEKKVRDIFDEAKQIAPCLMFIDEIDAITQKRETAQREMERRIVAQLLTCMDGNTSPYFSKSHTGLSSASGKLI